MQLPHLMSQPGMPPATAALYDRVAGLYTSRSVTQSERRAIQVAMGANRDRVTFDTLPSRVQELILAIEGRPQVGGWARPQDAPMQETAPAAPQPDGSPYMTVEQAAPPRPRQSESRSGNA